MKQIFRKNQIIITALALMICAAGYLQFAAPEEGVAVGNKDVLYEAKTDETADNGVVTVQVATATGNITTAQNTIEVNEGEDRNKAEDTHQIGDAVMVSTTLKGNFTSNARLVREQRRAQSKETLMGIIDNASLTEEQKQIAVETLVNLTTISEKENAAELLLEAKGFADPIVNIAEGEVDVVINAIEVTDRQIAQIEDIVMRKTGYEAKNITITAAIQED